MWIDNSVDRDQWHNYHPGDLVDIRGTTYLYLGLNNKGGIGRPGIPEPYFTTAKPEIPPTYFYLRNSEELSEELFATIITFDSGLLQFLCVDHEEEIRKIGHITPSKWDTLVLECERIHSEQLH